MTSPLPQDHTGIDAFDQLVARRIELTAELEQVDQALSAVAFSLLLNQVAGRVHLALKWGISRPTFNRYMAALEAKYGVTLPPSRHSPKAPE